MMQKAENLGCTEYREPCPEAARCPTKGWKWEPVAPGPTRDGNGTLHFADFPEFKPNKTPMEMLQEGCFGGGYDFWPFRSRKLRGTEDTGWCELPQAWIEGLDPDIHLNGSKNGCYNKAVNKFQVSVDSSVDEWLAAGRPTTIFILFIHIVPSK